MQPQCGDAGKLLERKDNQGRGLQCRILLGPFLFLLFYFFSCFPRRETCFNTRRRHPSFGSDAVVLHSPWTDANLPDRGHSLRMAFLRGVGKGCRLPLGPHSGAILRAGSILTPGCFLTPIEHQVIYLFVRMIEYYLGFIIPRNLTRSALALRRGSSGPRLEMHRGFV